jgi:hypothetical protein
MIITIKPRDKYTFHATAILSLCSTQKAFTKLHTFRISVTILYFRTLHLLTGTTIIPTSHVRGSAILLGTDHRGAGVAQSIYCLTTDWTTKRSRFDPWQRQKDFSFNLCVQTGSGTGESCWTLIVV